MLRRQDNDAGNALESYTLNFRPDATQNTVVIFSFPFLSA